ncbi:COG1 family protein [Megaselia abdita]
MTDFLTLNVDKLFEEHAVQEIDQIHRKVQTEVESKRELLRLKVGERYRDLLKAADTITKMKATSEEVVESVQRISQKCRTFNERQLLGFEVETSETQHLNRLSNKHVNNYFGTVVQIKLLTSLPEMIWSHLDKEQFFIATQLFTFARHISTGLQLDTNNSVMKHFPVAKKQWEMMKPFFFTIKQSALEVLEREDLTEDSATDCLLSLFLLEKSSLDSIFQSFLNLRVNALKKCLESDERVKEKIISSLRVLNSTVELVWKCFFENGKGMIVENLENLSTSENGTLGHLTIKDVEIVRVLPDIILKFRPTFDKPTLNPDALRKSMNDWFQIIDTVCGSLLKNNFEMITSMKTIQELKKEALGLDNPKEWSLLCTELSIKLSDSFYDNKYHPLINNRVRAIIKNSWMQSVDSTYNVIVKELMEPQQHSLWIEDMADVPSSLKDIKNNHLLMKTKGYSDGILSISKEFDLKLKDILEEIEVLMKESNSIKEDKIALIEFMKETSASEICNLISKLKCLGNESGAAAAKESYLFLARVLMGFVELCPNLKESLSWYSIEDGDNWKSVSDDKRNLEKWNQISGLLFDESFYYWRGFCDLLMKDILKEDCILEGLGFNGVLKDFLNWESIAVEETTTIRIPSQPRVSLQQYLLKVSQLLSDYIPQTLPTKVLHYFNGKLIENLIRMYESIGNEKFIEGNQNAALQIYFDLKFIQTIFTKRDDRNILDRIQKLSDTLKTSIDPFDFELFHTHLNANIKKCVVRMKAQLGILLPYPEKVDLLLAGGTDTKPSTATTGSEPNVISLSSSGSSSTWFPLLPIIVQEEKVEVPKEGELEVELPQQSSSAQPKKTNGKSSSSSTRPVKSSFFGMSQEWFK